MEIMLVISGIAILVTLVWNIYLACDNIDLRSELKQLREEVEFKEKVLDWRDASITELIQTVNRQQNELNWYRNATNSEPKK